MSTITTAAAASEAHVTVATIRTWCRRGVVAAVKSAGRWLIEAASLAHRIAIGAMRTRKATKPMIDLAATYTWTPAGQDQARTITPTVKRRVNGRGIETINITGLIPLFADRFAAITDEGDRLHALTFFSTAMLSIWGNGEIRTTYRGGAAGITVDEVLELGAKLRAQLAA